MDTHTVEIDSTGTQTWTSTVDQDHFVAAMTAVPDGEGSKASCAIDKGEGTRTPRG